MKKVVLIKRVDETTQDKISFTIHDSMSDVSYPDVNMTFSAVFTRKNGDKISRVYGRQQTTIEGGWLDFWIQHYLKDGYNYLKA